jgi:predicted RND superfamily exporter protein
MVAYLIALKKYRKGLFFLLFVLMGFCLWQLRALKIDADDSSLESDRVRKETALQRRAGQITKIPVVTLLLRREGELSFESFLESGEKIHLFLKDHAALHELKDFYNTGKRPSSSFLSQDRASMFFLFSFSEHENFPLEALQRSLKKLSGSASLHWLGVPVVNQAAVKAIAGDQKIILPLVILSMGGLLFLFLGSWRALFLPLFIALCTLLVTLGAYAFFGEELNMMTSMLMPVSLVMSLSVSVHLIHALQGHLNEEFQQETALVKALEDVFLPSALSCLTTSAGLSSLCFSPVPALRLFGAYGAFSVLLSGVFGLFLLPLLLSLSRFRFSGGVSKQSRGMAWISTSLNHPGKVVLFFLALFLLALPPLKKLEVDTDFLASLKEDSVLRRDMKAFEKSFGGFLDMGILIALEDFDSEGKALKKLIEALADVPEVLDLQPSLREAPDPFLKSVAFQEGPRALESFQNLGGVPNMLVSCRLKSLSSKQARKLREKMARKIAKFFPRKSWCFSGNFVKIFRDSDAIVRSQLFSLFVALLLILMIIFFALPSFKYLFLATVANVFPLLLLFAVMGVYPVALSVATSTIASVAIGLAVDDTLHVLCRYRKFRKRAWTCRNSLEAIYHSTGKALLFTTLTLSLGFSLGFFGSFVPTAQFSVLTALTLLLAWLVDFLLLPALLMLMDARKESAV